jgi:hypothetical protein
MDMELYHDCTPGVPSTTDVASHLEPMEVGAAFVPPPPCWEPDGAPKSELELCAVLTAPNTFVAPDAAPFDTPKPDPKWDVAAPKLGCAPNAGVEPTVFVAPPPGTEPKDGTEPNAAPNAGPGPDAGVCAAP